MDKVTAVILVSIFLNAFGGPIENLQPGEWYEVPNSKLDALNPCPQGNCPYTAWSGFKGIMSAWCGGAFDTKRDRLIIWGGGHADYGGNEIYVFDLNSLKWERLTNPSPVVVDAPYCSDGLPSSRHTWECIEYVASTDRFISFGGAALYGSGNSHTKNTDAFDFITKTWERKTQIPTQAVVGMMAAYDPVTGTTWSGKGTLARYNPASDTWTKQTEYDNNIYWESRMVMDIDYKRRKLVSVGGGKVYQWDVSNLNATINSQLLATTGDAGIAAANCPGVVYDPVSDRIVAWSGGADVYTLALDTKVWTKHAKTGGPTPTGAEATGTYGRFRYSPNKNVFVAVNRTSENVNLYRLTGGTGREARISNSGTASAILVSPNPVVRSATITLPRTAAKGTILRVYDASGKKAADLSNLIGRGGTAAWDGGQLSGGLYLLKAEMDGKVYSKKLLLQK